MTRLHFFIIYFWQFWYIYFWNQNVKARNASKSNDTFFQSLSLTNQLTNNENTPLWKYSTMTISISMKLFESKIMIYIMWSISLGNPELLKNQQLFDLHRESNPWLYGLDKSVYPKIQSIGTVINEAESEHVKQEDVSMKFQCMNLILLNFGSWFMHNTSLSSIVVACGRMFTMILDQEP